MQDRSDDTNESNEKNVDGTGHVTGHNSLWHDIHETGSPPGNNGHQTAAMGSGVDPGVPQPTTKRNSESTSETNDANLESELYKFDLHKTTVHSENGEPHTTGQIRVERAKKEASGDARRKAKSRAKGKADGWRRIELKIRDDVADPLREIAAAMNEASLHGEPLFERLIAMIKRLDDGA